MKNLRNLNELITYLNSVWVEDVRVYFEILITDKNYNFLSELFWKQYQYLSEELIVKKIIFEEKVHINCSEKIFIKNFSKEKIPHSIIRNLEFKKEVSFFWSIPFKKDKGQKICITNCVFNDTYKQLAKYNLPAITNFTNNDFKKWILFDSEWEDDLQLSIEFNGCILWWKSSIKNNKFSCDEISFSNCEINKIEFENIKINKLKILDSLRNCKKITFKKIKEHD